MLKTSSRDGNPETWLRTYADCNCNQAFANLVEYYGGMVYASALRRTASPELAEEVSQDVFVLMARKATKLREHSSLTGWVYTATRLRAQDVMKAERRNRARLAKLREMTTQSGVTEPLSDSSPALDEAFDRLKPRDRDILLWRYVEEQPYEEISQRLGKTKSACRKQASRALETLSGILKRRGYAVPAISIASVISSQLGKAAPQGLTASIANVAALKAGSICLPAVSSQSISTLTSGIVMKLNSIVIASALIVLPFGVAWTLGLGLTLGTLYLMGPAVHEGPEAIVMPLIQRATDPTSRRHQAAVDAAYMKLAAQAISAITKEEQQRVMAAGLALYEAEPDGLWRTYDRLPLTDRQRPYGLANMSNKGGVVAMEALERGYLRDDLECLQAGARLITNAAYEHPERCVRWLENLAERSGYGSPYLLLSNPWMLQNMTPALQHRLMLLIEKALMKRAHGKQLLEVDEVASIVNARIHLSSPTRERLHKALLANLEIMDDQAFDLTLQFSSITPPVDNPFGEFSDTPTEREISFILANASQAEKRRFLADGGEALLNISQRQNQLIDDVIEEIPELVRAEDFGGKLDERLSGPPDDKKVRQMAKAILHESPELSVSLNELNDLSTPWRDALAAMIIGMWASKDVVAASHALARTETIPDTAIVELVKEIALDRNAALAWANHIQNPSLRTSALEQIQ